MRRKRLEKQLYYGLAVLLALFIIVGLTSALKEGGKESRETVQTRMSGEMESEKDAGEEKGGDRETKDGKKDQGGTDDGKAENPNIRVLLMTNGYSHTTHEKVVFSMSSGGTISYGDKKEKVGKKKKITIKPDDKRFKEGTIRISPTKGRVTVNSLKRGCGTPSYSGEIELRTTAEGIVMINELPLESYLCGVVPSEMPAAYELEALKAQAVCARSYACRQMEEYGYPEYKAHVNDSTDYQVYGNSGYEKKTTQAVKETAGETVQLDDKIVTTYYYSTSCGKTTSLKAWGTKDSKSNRYLKSVKVKGEEGYYEEELPWYRWEATVPVETMSDLVGLNTGKDVGTINSIKVAQKGPGGVALKLVIKGEKGSVTVKTENKIRRALGGAGYTICRQDGSEVDSSELLPSAFFTVAKKKGNFIIKGGGFGHGIGMSQNGANEMAKTGKDYKEILKLFYQGVEVKR